MLWHNHKSQGTVFTLYYLKCENCCESDPDLNLTQRKRNTKTPQNNNKQWKQVTADTQNQLQTALAHLTTKPTILSSSSTTWYPEPIADRPSPHNDKAHNPFIEPNYPLSGTESNPSLETPHIYRSIPNTTNPPHWTWLVAARSWPQWLIKFDHASPESHPMQAKVILEQEPWSRNTHDW